MGVPIAKGNQFLNIGRYIASKRNARGLKQKEAAHLSNIKIRYIQLVEQGKQKNPKVLHLARLLQTYGYRLEIVPIAGDEEMPVVRYEVTDE
jgi:transcriptional regulator with XRE-family HTH domain